MSLLVALLLSGTSVELDPAWQPVADPKALVTGGQIHCLDPDPVRRTCSQMTWYSAAPDGEVRYRTVAALSNQYALAMQHTGKLRWDGDAICLFLDTSAMENAHLVRLAAPHSRVTDPRFFLYTKEEMAQAVVNRTICARAYRHREHGDYLSISTIDGEFAGGLMEAFSLIDAKAGYRLHAAND